MVGYRWPLVVSGTSEHPRAGCWRTARRTPVAAAEQFEWMRRISGGVAILRLDAARRVGRPLHPVSQHTLLREPIAERIVLADALLQKSLVLLESAPFVLKIALGRRSHGVVLVCGLAHWGY